MRSGCESVRCFRRARDTGEQLPRLCDHHVISPAIPVLVGTPHAVEVFIMMTHLALLRRMITVPVQPAAPAHAYDYDAIGENARWYYETSTRNEIDMIERAMHVAHWSAFTHEWHNIGYYAIRGGV